MYRHACVSVSKPIYKDKLNYYLEYNDFEKKKKRVENGMHEIKIGRKDNILMQAFSSVVTGK